MEPKDILNLIIAILGLIFTLAATIIAICDIISSLKEKKINNLILSNRILANSYWKICEKAINMYHNKIEVNDLVKPKNKPLPPMLYKDKWLFDPADGKIPSLSSIKVTICENLNSNKKTQSHSHRFVMWRFFNLLPYSQKTLEQNLSLYCDANWYDGQIYSPVEYKKEGASGFLTVIAGSYFEFINTSLCISFGDAYEIATKTKLKMRQNISLFNFNNRTSKTGIVTLTILSNVNTEENKYDTFFILHKRSNNVCECQNMINAIPAGEYQPSYHPSKSTPQPDALGYTIFREFGEELLGYKEFTELNSTEEISNLFSFDTSTDINEHVLFLGAAINPANLYLVLLTAISLDMSSTGIQDLFGGKTKVDEIEKKLKKNEESEEIFIEEFTLEKIDYYSHMHLCSPELKQIMTIFKDYCDANGNEKKNERFNKLKEMLTTKQISVNNDSHLNQVI